MSGLTRDEAAGPIPRHHILGRGRGQRKFILPIQLTTSRIDSYAWSELNLLEVMAIHTQYSEEAPTRPNVLCTLKNECASFQYFDCTLR